MQIGIDPYQRIATLRRSRVSFAVCTVVDARGSSPRKRGARMLVFDDGRIEGTIGGGAIEHAIVGESGEAIAAGENRLVDKHLTHELGMCCGGGMTVFIEVQTYAPRLFVFGCGHVGRPIAELAARCGFEVTAIDRRPEFGTPEAFGPRSEGLRVVCAEPVDVLETMELGQDESYAVVVTHDHDLDEAIVAGLLRRPLRYLGCIGSVRKGAKFRQRLAARGFTEEEVGRMRTPMGLDIGALLPDEIAVSVVAELIATRRSAATRSESA